MRINKVAVTLLLLGISTIGFANPTCQNSATFTWGQNNPPATICGYGQVTFNLPQGRMNTKHIYIINTGTNINVSVSGNGDAKILSGGSGGICTSAGRCWFYFNTGPGPHSLSYANESSSPVTIQQQP